jgi:hypothetical protein
MSFGFSVGDFIAIGQLTWTVYRACKGAPGEFQELSRELSTLHTILHELEDEAKSPNSLLNRRGSGRKSEFDVLQQNLSIVLKQIEDIVNRYHSLGRDQKRTWDRVKYATEDLTNLRAKLSFHINGISLFVASLSASSLARIEGILDALVQDIREGKKEPTVVSVCDEDDELAWGELERELIGDGITRQDVEKHKDEIKAYLLKLVEENIGTIASPTASPDDPDGPFPSESSYLSYILGRYEEDVAPTPNVHTGPQRAAGAGPASLLIPAEKLGSAHQDLTSLTQLKPRPSPQTRGEEYDSDAPTARWAPPPPDPLVITKIAASIQTNGLEAAFRSTLTSRKRATFICAHIIRVLQDLEVNWTPISSGFHCAVSVYKFHGDYFFYHGMWPEGYEGGNIGRVVPSTSFDILLSKVRLLPLHGIRFSWRILSPGREVPGDVQYVIDSILAELRQVL